jgi:hypothetical protein
MPGSIMSTPKYFRISLTASEAMVERALSAFVEMGRRQATGSRRQK